MHDYHSRMIAHQLEIGKMYEVSCNDYRSLVPWFEAHDMKTSAKRPKNGTYVVYLGRQREEDSYSLFYYSILSSEGKLYRIYNSDFVYGLKKNKGLKG